MKFVNMARIQHEGLGRPFEDLARAFDAYIEAALEHEAPEALQCPVKDRRIYDFIRYLKSVHVTTPDVYIPFPGNDERPHTIRHVSRRSGQPYTG